MGSILTFSNAGHRAVLHLAMQKACMHRAALIVGLDELVADSDAAAAAMQFGRATALSLSATVVRLKVRDLTRRIDQIQNELNETEQLPAAVEVKPSPAAVLKMHEAFDEMAGLVAA